MAHYHVKPKGTREELARRPPPPKGSGIAVDDSPRFVMCSTCGSTFLLAHGKCPKCEVHCPHQNYNSETVITRTVENDAIRFYVRVQLTCTDCGLKMKMSKELDATHGLHEIDGAK